MEFLEILGFITAKDTAIQSAEQQITFENFIVQAQNKGILSQKHNNCPNQPSKDDYLLLYDALVDAEIIVKKINGFSVITWSSSYTISNKISKEPKDLETTMENKNSNYYNKLKPCFVVDWKKLSEFLIQYKYHPTDQLRVLAGGGKRKARKTKKMRKRKTK